MELQDDKTIQMTGIIWKIEDGLITFTLNGQKIILNKSLSCIVKKINGIRTIKEIVDEIANEYKMQNSYNDIKKYVYEGIKLLYDEKFININEKDDDYGGWYEYN